VSKGSLTPYRFQCPYRAIRTGEAKVPNKLPIHILCQLNPGLFSQYGPVDGSVDPQRGKTTDRRATCGRPARVVRREGRPERVFPTPIELLASGPTAPARGQGLLSLVKPSKGSPRAPVSTIPTGRAEAPGRLCFWNFRRGTGTGPSQHSTEPSIL